MLQGRLSSCPRSWIQKLDTHLVQNYFHHHPNIPSPINSFRQSSSTTNDEDWKGYFVPERTGQAAWRVISSPSPLRKRLYLQPLNKLQNMWIFDKHVDQTKNLIGMDKEGNMLPECSGSLLWPECETQMGEDSCSSLLNVGFIDEQGGNPVACKKVDWQKW